MKAMDSTGGPADFARYILRSESKLPGIIRLRPEGIYEGPSRLAALDTPARTRQLLQFAATKFTVEPRDLDRAIWLHESPSK